MAVRTIPGCKPVDFAGPVSYAWLWKQSLHNSWGIVTGNLLKFAVSIIAVFLAGLIGSLVTDPAISTWYAGLRKPFFQPPNWLFGPVWTALYLAMAIALFLVWRQGWSLPRVRTGLILFGVQLLLNSLWSVLFFGLRSPLTALIEIFLLWVTILLTMIVFFELSTIAGILLVPYLLWTSFATILNAAIVYLNR